MGNRCVIGGCSNTSRKGRVAIYALPKEPVTIRQAWVRFIRSTRLNFNANDYKKVCVCSGLDLDVDLDLEIC